MSSKGMLLHAGPVEWVWAAASRAFALLYGLLSMLVSTELTAGNVLME